LEVWSAESSSDGADEKFGLAATLSLGAVVYRKVI